MFEQLTTHSLRMLGMRKALSGFICFLILPLVMTVGAQESENPFRLDHPDEYIVVKGDTLWDISETFLSSPWLWPEIWHVNPQVENPHLIYPGDKISLVYLDGQPRLTLERGSGDRTVKLSPTKRFEPLDTVIPAIPLDAVSPFLKRSRIISEDALEQASYVIAGYEGRIVTGGGDRLYARDHLDGGSQKYATYGIYRPGVRYIDPDTGEYLGTEALEIAIGKVIGKEGDIATVSLNSSTEEVRLEDRLLPTEENKLIPTFFPSSPSSDIDGKIISVLGGVSQVGQFDVVSINRGERDDLKVGNVLAIYHQSGVVRDRIRSDVVQLPSERAGLLMVFRTFEKMSYGIVLKAQRPLAVKDGLRNP